MRLNWSHSRALETDQVILYSDRDIEYVEWLLCSAAVTSDSPKSLVLMIVFFPFEL